MDPLDNITFALIGHGQAGNSFYNALADLPGVRFRWVIGRRPEDVARFARERSIPQYSVELEAALSDPSVDALLICTPNLQHFGQAMRALKAGKHVVVEVPLAMSAGEAQELVCIASERGLLLSVSHNARYLTAYKLAKEIISSNELGRIYQIIYRRLELKRENKGWTNRTRSWADSVTWHHTAHAADLASWLLNEPLQCAGAAIGRFAAHDQTTDVSAVFTTPSSTVITLTLSYNSTLELFDCALIGENGLLELQDFTAVRHNGVEIFREQVDPVESLELAYHRYALALVKGLRGEGPIPTAGIELLPIMEQLERMHTSAFEITLPEKNNKGGFDEI